LIHPYGNWPSPIRADQLALAALRISQPRVEHDSVYWLEGRPAEGGRQQVMCARNAFESPGSPPVECTPEAVNVRTRVHEYGGGDYRVAGERVFYVDFTDQRIYAMEAGSSAPLSPPGPRYADFAATPERDWLLAVEEGHRQGQEPENRLVAFALPKAGLPHTPRSPRVIAQGHDFYSSPVVSADGRQVAFLAWRHPNMPWDGTTLFLQPWGPDGPTGSARAVAGGEAESIFQPEFSPAGTLTFVSDRSGWWNLYQLRDSGAVPVCPRAEEFGGPQWVFGLSRYAFASERTILCAHGVGGQSRLGRLDLQTGALEDLQLPYTSFDGLRVEGQRACFVGAGPVRPSAVVALDLETNRCRELRLGSTLEFDPSCLVVPQAFEFESVDGRRSHAWVYAPAVGAVEAPGDERPPLLVKSHGGPTASASSALDLRLQYWASRGIAVVDVDYGGSTGYGRNYRELLRGQWGIIDVEDCVHAARALSADGSVDTERLAISGGSAGGYTTLCALTFHDTFRAGASHYGIGDLEALARDTHKFEARYTDGLVGPYPEAKEIYRARSPIHFTERLNCPVAFFQGLEDEIVPPGQAEAMVAALARQGIAHAYVPFEGEQHGFRQAENIRQALEGELYFYGKIFGFETDADAGRVRIVG
jgi:dipeptidyl aminopeptidase/acylaminoacyl peptidase